MSDLSLEYSPQAFPPGTSEPVAKTSSGENLSENRDCWPERQERLDLFKQFKQQATDLKEYVDALEHTHTEIINALDSAQKDADIAEENFRRADEIWKAAGKRFNQTFTDYDLVCKQLKTALGFLLHYESQGGEIYKPIILPPLVRDAIGQTQLPSILGTIPLYDGVEETIELEPFSKGKRWKTDPQESGMWKVVDKKTEKEIIIIHRPNKETIQIEWTDAMKQNSDPFINDVRFSVLVITHTVTVDGQEPIRRKQYRPLVDVDPDYIKKIFEQ